VGADPDHTVEWLVGYIREPKSIKENSRMPPMEGKISDADIQAVAEYLASLK
jgi:mono/diheme cytochrome c family protein